MFYKDERIGLMIDGVNLNGVARALEFEIDFSNLRTLFAKKGRLVFANYYTTILEGEDYSPVKPLIDWLDYNGFNVTSKVARHFTDAEGRRKIKGSMNVEMAVDAVSMAQHIDHLVLFTGDGEMRAAVEAAQKLGVRVSVCSSMKTTPTMASDDLRRQANSFIEFDDLRSEVSREQKLEKVCA